MHDLLTDVRFDRNKNCDDAHGVETLSGTFFSLTRVVTVDLSPSVSETPRKGSNPELPHKTGSRESGGSLLRVLIG